MPIAVAIDGPSGAGKSSLARRVANDLHYIYVDTGAMYRSIGFEVLERGLSPEDTQGVIALLPELSVSIGYKGDEQRVFVGDKDVSDFIRTPAVSMAASKVSAIPEVRAFLLQVQRDLAKKNNVLMDGRDIGTVILPDAQVKIFLTASVEARAKRRFLELQEKGDPSTLEEVMADIEQRDYNDTHRATAPLRQAPDAILIDTTEVDKEGSVLLIKQTIENQLKKLGL